MLCISVYPRLYSGAVFDTGSFIVFLYRNSKRGVFRKPVVAHAELLCCDLSESGEIYVEVIALSDIRITVLSTGIIE